MLRSHNLQLATAASTSAAPLCTLEGIAVYAIRLADDPSFVQRIAELRGSAFGEGQPWHYGLDQLDQQAIQMVAFEADEPVGALRVCPGDELLATSGLEGFYLSAGWEFEPRAASFFDTTLEYGRFWVVRGHRRTQAVMNALLASVGAYAAAHPRYRNIFGTVALLDHAPEACQLIADYLRRYHLPAVHWVRPRRPLGGHASAPPPASAPAPAQAPAQAQAQARLDAFRTLFHQLNEIDPDHRLPALLHLYLRRGAQMLGDVTLDETGRKLLIPLYVDEATFQSFVAGLRRRATA